MTFTNAHGGTEAPKPAGSAAKKNKKRAYNQEIRVADKQTSAGMPARRVIMSGALKGVGLDGDVAAEWWLGECKNYTPVQDSTGTYLKMYFKWIDKIIAEAALHGKPGIVIYQAKGRPNAYVVADLDQFVELIGKAYRALKGNQ